MGRLDKWRNREIQDDGGTTSDDFRKFATDFREDLRFQLAPKEIDIVGYNKGHYYVSGFMRNRKTDKFGYFSISDVRYFNDWQTNILVRSARDMEDFTGGPNNTATVESFADVAERVTNG